MEQVSIINHPLTQGVIFGIVNVSVRFLWGISSFGRALPWHGRGDRFESDMLHHIGFGQGSVFHIAHGELAQLARAHDSHS